jgi:hypothetical protein
MEHAVCFLYRIGQEVWYVHKIKRVPKHARISEIKIHITDMGPSPSDYMSPTIEYLICGNWYKENELWDNKENFKAWYNNKFCRTQELKFENDNAIWFENAKVDDEIKVKVLSLISRINNSHPWKKMNIAEIFYFNKEGKPRFRYVPLDDIMFITEPSSITENKYELMKKYGQYYVEDAIYNFVNYDGIKF